MSTEIVLDIKSSTKSFDFNLAKKLYSLFSSESRVYDKKIENQNTCSVLSGKIYELLQYETYINFFGHSALDVYENDIIAHKNIQTLFEYQKNSQYDKAAYWVYDKFIDYVQSNRIIICDRMLQYIDVERYDINILLSLLMATFACRNRLNSRSVFYAKVKKIISTQYPEEEARMILANLEK